jgi:hypothetical protein
MPLQPNFNLTGAGFGATLPVDKTAAEKFQLYMDGIGRTGYVLDPILKAMQKNKEDKAKLEAGEKTADYLGVPGLGGGFAEGTITAEQVTKHKAEQKKLKDIMGFFKFGSENPAGTPDEATIRAKTATAAEDANTINTNPTLSPTTFNQSLNTGANPPIAGASGNPMANLPPELMLEAQQVPPATAPLATGVGASKEVADDLNQRILDYAKANPDVSPESILDLQKFAGNFITNKGNVQEQEYKDQSNPLDLTSKSIKNEKDQAELDADRKKHKWGSSSAGAIPQTKDQRASEAEIAAKERSNTPSASGSNNKYLAVTEAKKLTDNPAYMQLQREAKFSTPKGIAAKAASDRVYQLFERIQQYPDPATRQQAFNKLLLQIIPNEVAKLKTGG